MIPVGLCQCGCGQETAISRWTNMRRATIAGQPYRYATGHSGQTKHAGYRVDEATGCWIYLGACKTDGYPNPTAYKGQMMTRHRAMFVSSGGTIPPGYDLDHLCRERRCLNPAHHEPVTRTENIRRSAATKLSADHAAQIRARLDAGEKQREIARAFGISQSNVSRIGSHEVWAS